MDLKLQVILLAAVVAATFVEGAVVKKKHRRNADPLDAIPGMKLRWDRGGRKAAGVMLPANIDGTESIYLFYLTGMEGADFTKEWHITGYGFNGDFKAVLYKIGFMGDCYATLLDKETPAAIEAQFKKNNEKDLSDYEGMPEDLQCGIPNDEDSAELLQQAAGMFPLVQKLCNKVAIYLCKHGEIPGSPTLRINSLNKVIRIFRQ